MVKNVGELFSDIYIDTHVEHPYHIKAVQADIVL